jgi:hypothetical protein
MNDTKQKAIELRLQGYSLRQISEVLNKSTSTIGRYTKEIKIICHPKYKTKFIQHDFFSEKNINNDPDRLILVGFIAADGCIYSGVGQNKLIIRLSHKDSHVLEIFNNLLCNKTRKISKSKLSQSIDFPSNQLCNDLSKYGIVPQKTQTLNWPHLSVDHARKFLLGYFYGDGCYHKYKNRDVIHLISTVKFADQMREFLVSHNIVDHCVVSKLKNQNYAQSVFQGKHAIKLSQWMFQDVKYPLLPRKHPF